VTRDSLLTLARSLGYKAHERRIALDEVLDGIGSGRCTELFACGTAAIVAPIAVLVEGDGREYRLRATDVVAKHLRESLLAIQERRAPDPFGWTQELTFN
jgi:branched-chain amino acid aminotransferase